MNRPLTIIAVLFLSTAGLRGQIPETINWQGYLTDESGEPLNGPVGLSLRLFDAVEAGTQVYRKDTTGALAQNGVVSVPIGPFPTVDFGRPLFLEIAVQGTGVLSPRSPLTSVPYALAVRGGRNSLDASDGDPVDALWVNAQGRVAINVAEEPLTSRLTVGGRLESRGGIPGNEGGQLTLLDGDGLGAWEIDTFGSPDDEKLRFFRNKGYSDISDALVIENTGEIGLGTRTPEARLEIASPENQLRLTDSANGNTFQFSARADSLTVLGERAGGSPVALLRFVLVDGDNLTHNVILGSENFISAGIVGATISGGGGEDLDAGVKLSNRVTDDFGTVGGGYLNAAAGRASTVGGGFSNIAGGSDATVGGGYFNKAGGNNAIVGGGSRNSASGTDATIGGGFENTAGGWRATVGGGYQNSASGSHATVGGGWRNEARGNYSFAGGYQARVRAEDEGSFAWNDRSLLGDSLVTTGSNQFLIRAGGGVGIGTNSPDGLLHISGTDLVRIERTDTGNALLALLAASGRGWRLISTGSDDPNGAGNFQIRDHTVSADRLTITQDGRVGIGMASPEHPLVVGSNTTNGNGAYVTSTGVWTNGSSRTFKRGSAPVDTEDILRRVAELPITRWQYTGEEDAEHIGPVAEDFFEAFRLGSDERYIGTVDADGVALAAIQGLHKQLLDERRKYEDLEERLAGLEQLVLSLVGAAGR